MFCWGEYGSILGSMARIWFVHPGKGSYSSTCCCDEPKSSKQKHAVVAQLVEHHLAKVDVASSSLVNRSTEAPRFASGLFVVSGFCCLWGFTVSGRFGFWRCGARGPRDLSRDGCLGGLAVRLSDYLATSGYLATWVLAAGLSDDLTVRSSGYREAIQEKSSKKFGAQSVRGRGGKTTLQVPSELLWRVKIGSKTLFLKKFKKLFNPKNPGNTRK